MFSSLEFHGSEILDCRVEICTGRFLQGKKTQLTGTEGRQGQGDMPEGSGLGKS